MFWIMGDLTYADNFENIDAVPESACTGPQKACANTTVSCEWVHACGVCLRKCGAAAVRHSLAAVRLREKPVGRSAA